MLYRIKQFYQAMTAKVTREDYMFVKECLDPNQMELFKELPLYEQRHCINVALTIRDSFSHNLSEEEKKLLLQAGLLHDIGKLRTGLNPFTKSLAVVIDKVNGNAGKNLSRQINFLDGYYNHPLKGKELLNKLNVSKELLFLVENHHNYEIKDHKLLEILTTADQLN